MEENKNSLEINISTTTPPRGLRSKMDIYEDMNSFTNRERYEFLETMEYVANNKYLNFIDTSNDKFRGIGKTTKLVELFIKGIQDGENAYFISVEKPNLVNPLRWSNGNNINNFRGKRNVVLYIDEGISISTINKFKTMCDIKIALVRNI